MMWWRDPRARRDLEEAVAQTNDARSERDDLYACDHYARAINKLFSLHRTLTRPDTENESDGRAFRLLVRATDPTDQEWFLDRTSVEELCQLRPLIGDHSVLRHQLLSESVPPDLHNEATGVHGQLADKYARLAAAPSSSRRQRDVLDALTRLLWVVRSNLAHGDKSVRGPDPERSRRNRDVAVVTRAVFDDLLEAVLAQPAHRLVAYGSLLPGRSNASALNDIDGTWSPITLVGTVDDVDGFPIFHWTHAGGDIEAQVLSSASLTPAIWQRLDEFEGSNYRRQLVVYTEPAAGDLGVANCYVGT